MENMFDLYRNVVHLGSPNCGGEFTLCGLAVDEPASEWGCDSMRDVKTPHYVIKLGERVELID